MGSFEQETKESKPGDVCKEDASQRFFDDIYFRPHQETFSPVRPTGLGELGIGKTSIEDAGQGLDFRITSSECNSEDGSTSFQYSGELEDSSFFGWTDTNFSASERVDRYGRLLESKIVYETPVDQSFFGPTGLPKEIEDVVEVTTKWNSGIDGYSTVVVSRDGTEHKFVTSSHGKVNYYETGPSYFEYSTYEMP